MARGVPIVKITVDGVEAGDGRDCSQGSAEKSEFYVYTLKDITDRIIYVGRTKRGINRRLREHFGGKGHLPKMCYRKTHTIEYAFIANEAEMYIYEIYLINKHNPHYNTQYKNTSCGEVGFCLPSLKWNALTKAEFLTLNKSEVTPDVLIGTLMSELSRSEKGVICKKELSDVLGCSYDKVHEMLRVDQMACKLKEIGVTVIAGKLRWVTPSQRDADRCSECGELIVKRNNRQKYCEECRVQVRRKKDRERNLRHYYRAKQAIA